MPVTITLAGSNTYTTDDGISSMPGSAGQFALYSDYSQDTGGSNSRNFLTSDGAGADFTAIGTKITVGSFHFHSASGRVLTASDVGSGYFASFADTVMSGILARFAVTGGTFGTPASSNQQGTTGNPTVQTITPTTDAGIWIGIYAASAAVSPRTSSLTATGELNQSTRHYMKYGIFNSGATSGTVDMADEGTNLLRSFWIPVVPDPDPHGAGKRHFDLPPRRPAPWLAAIKSQIEVLGAIHLQAAPFGQTQPNPVLARSPWVAVRSQTDVQSAKFYEPAGLPPGGAVTELAQRLASRRAAIAAQTDQVSRVHLQGVPVQRHFELPPRRPAPWLTAVKSQDEVRGTIHLQASPINTRHFDNPVLARSPWTAIRSQTDQVSTMHLQAAPVQSHYVNPVLARAPWWAAVTAQDGVGGRALYQAAPLGQTQPNPVLARSPWVAIRSQTDVQSTILYQPPDPPPGRALIDPVRWMTSRWVAIRAQTEVVALAHLQAAPIQPMTPLDMPLRPNPFVAIRAQSMVQGGAIFQSLAPTPPGIQIIDGVRFIVPRTAAIRAQAGVTGALSLYVNPTYPHIQGNGTQPNPTRLSPWAAIIAQASQNGVTPYLPPPPPEVPGEEYQYFARHRNRR